VQCKRKDCKKLIFEKRPITPVASPVFATMNTETNPPLPPLILTVKH
jgi:hypothetical protein